MKRIKWRKYNRNIHRDLGYFFAVMTVIYGISGIALNHVDEWDPNYQILKQEVQVDLPEKSAITEDFVKEQLKAFDLADEYKKHYFPGQKLKVFLKSGSLVLNLETGEGTIESVKERVVLRPMNFLHYNNIKKLYTWFADIYGAALVVLAITGLFILRGKQGIKGRGAWLSIAGLIIPLAFLLIYYW